MDATTQTEPCADVLVIDDDEIMRDLVADWLEAAGYEVRKAADSRSGLAEIDRAQPALVVTDMCMPGSGGSAIIRSVSQGHPAIPIIAISGYFSLSGSSAEAVLALGAARVLAKPVERSAIMQAVAELVGTPHR